MKGDLHITEVKNVTVASVDCGLNAHDFKETIIQLWVNELSGVEAEWTGEKALNILHKVGLTQRYDLSSTTYF